jgi:hypothetical protein
MTIETAKEYIKHRARPRFNKHYDDSAVIENTMRSGWIVHDFALSVEHDINIIHDVSRAYLTSTHEERINFGSLKKTHEFIMISDGNTLEIQRCVNMDSLKNTHKFIGMNTLGTMPIFNKL